MSNYLIFISIFVQCAEKITLETTEKLALQTYPASYYSKADCMYKIEVSSGMRIKIRFQKFITEAAGGGQSGMLGKEMRNMMS